MWDLQDPSVFSPLWGAWFGSQYVIANGILSSQAAALVFGAAPSARVITDTLTGTDASVAVSQVHLWTRFNVTFDTVATLHITFRTSPMQVFLDDAVVTGSACAYDNPASNTCTDGTPCASIPVWLSQGTHTLELRTTTPGVIALAAIVAAGGSVLTQTNSSWYVAWDMPAGGAAPSSAQSLATGLATDLPGPPQSFFTLEHPQLGTAMRVDASSLRLCGVGGAIRMGGGTTAVFSAPVEMDAYNWAFGFSRLHLAGGGVVRTCYGTMRVDTDTTQPGDRYISFRLVPVAGGGWLVCSTMELCAGYDAATDSMPFVAATQAPVGSSGAPVAWVLRVWPNLPAAVAPLALWLDGSNTASVTLDGVGGVPQWADTRDTYVVSPRVVSSMGTSAPGWGGLSCPLHFDGNTAMAQAHGWDWAVPTTLTVVISQTAGGAILSAHDYGNATTGMRALTLLPSQHQAPLPVDLSGLHAGGLLTTPPIIQQRSPVPTVVSAQRASPTTWAIYVNGALVTSTSFAFPYSSGCAYGVAQRKGP